MRFNLRSLFCWVTIAAIVILLANSLRNRQLARWKHSRAFWSIDKTTANLRGVMRETITNMDRVKESLESGGHYSLSTEMSASAGGTASGEFQRELRAEVWKSGAVSMKWRIAIRAKLKHDWDWRISPPHRTEIRYRDDEEHRTIVDAMESRLHEHHENLVVVRIPDTDAVGD